MDEWARKFNPTFLGNIDPITLGYLLPRVLEGGRVAGRVDQWGPITVRDTLKYEGGTNGLFRSRRMFPVVIIKVCT